VLFSAEDVAYTLNTLRDYGPKVKWGVDVQQASQATGDRRQYRRVGFVIPRRVLLPDDYKYDIGVYIVPKHIFEGQDWTTFKHFDLAKGWPVSTGPWQVVAASAEQRCSTGGRPGGRRMPGWRRCRRSCATSGCPVSPSSRSRGVITNQIDCTALIQPLTFPTLFAQTRRSPPMPGATNRSG